MCSSLEVFRRWCKERPGLRRLMHGTGNEPVWAALLQRVTSDSCLFLNRIGQEVLKASNPHVKGASTDKGGQV